MISRKWIAALARLRGGGTPASRTPGAEPQRQAPGHQLTLEQLSPRDSLKTFSSALVAWRADYNSLQSPDGTVILVASFLLENAGAETAHFLIPEGAKRDEVWGHGKQYTPDEVLIDKRRCQFRRNDPAA